jgi:hypothetical protein
MQGRHCPQAGLPRTIPTTEENLALPVPVRYSVKTLKDQDSTASQELMSVSKGQLTALLPGPFQGYLSKSVGSLLCIYCQIIGIPRLLGN